MYRPLNIRPVAFNYWSSILRAWFDYLSSYKRTEFKTAIIISKAFNKPSSHSGNCGCLENNRLQDGHVGSSPTLGV